MTPEEQQQMIDDAVRQVYESGGGLKLPAPPEPPAPVTEHTAPAPSDWQLMVQVLVDEHGFNEKNAMDVIGSGGLAGDPELASAVTTSVLAYKKGAEDRAAREAADRLANQPEERLKAARAVQTARAIREEIANAAYVLLSEEQGVSEDEIRASVGPEEAITMSGLGVERQHPDWKDLDRANTLDGISPEDLAALKLPLGYQVRTDGDKNTARSTKPGEWATR